MAAPPQQHESRLNYNSLRGQSRFSLFLNHVELITLISLFVFCSVCNMQTYQHRKERRDVRAKF